MQMINLKKRKQELYMKKSVNVFWLSGLSQMVVQGIFISILKDSRYQLRVLHALTFPFRAVATVTACT